MKLLPFLKSKEPGSDSAPVSTLERGNIEQLDLLGIVMKELFEAKTNGERANAFRAAFQLLEQEPHEENNGELESYS